MFKPPPTKGIILDHDRNNGVQLEVCIKWEMWFCSMHELKCYCSDIWSHHSRWVMFHPKWMRFQPKQIWMSIKEGKAGVCSPFPPTPVAHLIIFLVSIFLLLSLSSQLNSLIWSTCVINLVSPHYYLTLLWILCCCVPPFSLLLGAVTLSSTISQLGAPLLEYIFSRVVRKQKYFSILPDLFLAIFIVETLYIVAFILHNTSSNWGVNKCYRHNNASPCSQNIYRISAHKPNFNCLSKKNPG